MKRDTKLAAVALALALTQPAVASQFMSCGGAPTIWPDDSLDMGYSPTSFPAGSQWHSMLVLATGRFNTNPSRFRITVRPDTKVGVHNGESEIWVSTPEHVPGLDGAAAIALWYRKCTWFPGLGYRGRMTEADIVFNSTPDGWNGWVASEAKVLQEAYGGNGLSMTLVTMHEMGHALGLLHEYDEYNLMHGGGGPYLQTQGSLARGYVGEDTGAGLAYMYGRRATRFRDLTVSHWKHAFIFGWSTHRRTRLLNSPDVDSVPPSYLDAGEPRYQVWPGDVVYPEFTYEISGGPDDSEQDVNVGFYLSSDDAISPSDRWLRSTTLDLSVGEAHTRRSQITVPADLRPGKYWLGVIVDDGNAIEEANEWDNATYLPIQVCSRVTCFEWDDDIPILSDGSGE